MASSVPEILVSNPGFKQSISPRRKWRQMISESPPHSYHHSAVATQVQTCQERQMLGCMILRCNLQHGITQPILTFLTYLYVLPSRAQLRTVSTPDVMCAPGDFVTWRSDEMKMSIDRSQSVVRSRAEDCAVGSNWLSLLHSSVASSPLPSRRF